MAKHGGPHFIQFEFPRKDEAGNEVVKTGWVKKDAIVAIEPGTSDAVSHLHLSNGADLIVVSNAMTAQPE